jgi:hypothetical protein
VTLASLWWFTTLNDKSKPLGKGLVLLVLECDIRVSDDNIISRLHTTFSRNSFNYVRNLVS